MKRHEALVPFSREHHDALILAQLLKSSVPDYKGLPSEPVDKMDYAINIFHSVLKPHFRKEEELLLKIKPGNSELSNMCKGIFEEHKQLENGFISLHDSADLTAALDELGHRLDRHIRKEERQLFPLIQEHCPDELAAML